MSALDSSLIAAHEAEDSVQLVALYSQAADEAERAGNIDAACFFLTHAYVFALEDGSARAAHLHARLVSFGREA